MIKTLMIYLQEKVYTSYLNVFTLNFCPCVQRQRQARGGRFKRHGLKNKNNAFNTCRMFRSSNLNSRWLLLSFKLSCDMTAVFFHPLL